jgi:hypothetical protein
MLGWLFGRRGCPVEPEERTWIEERTRWLCREFGLARLRQGRVILPSPEFFPDRWDSSPDAAAILFRRVREYMDLADEEIALDFYHEAEERVGTMPGVVHSSQGTAGLFHDARSGPDGRLTIFVEVGQLARPMSLVATLAHELGHVHLLGHRRITNEVEDHEPLTDLLTVFLGLGVFLANSIIHETNWMSGRRSGWSVGRQGYLTQDQAGYALALFAWLRGEVNPAWAKEVCADVHEPLYQGLRFLADSPSPELVQLRDSAS